jgi:signal transduction histidine kinase
VSRLGFRPQLRFDGPLDRTTPAELHRPIAAAVRDALSNVGRHAAARVEVLVQTSSAELTLRVSDDGCDLPDRTHGDDLAALHRHAVDLGTRLETHPGLDGRGLTVAWQVPLRRPLPTPA